MIITDGFSAFITMLVKSVCSLRFNRNGLPFFPVLKPLFILCFCKLHRHFAKKNTEWWLFCIYSFQDDLCRRFRVALLHARSLFLPRLPYFILGCNRLRMFGRAAAPVGIKTTRFYQRYIDVKIPHFLAQRIRQAFERPFGSMVHPDVRERYNATDT